MSTPDSLLLEYLQLWGEVESPKIVKYERFTDSDGDYGEGMMTGDRSVRLKLRKKHLPRNHLLQGKRVEMTYPGQRECFRCLKQASECPGRSNATECERNGGTKVHWIDTVKAIYSEEDFDWNEIGEVRDNDEPVERQAAPSEYLKDEEEYDNGILDEDSCPIHTYRKPAI